MLMSKITWLKVKLKNYSGLMMMKQESSWKLGRKAAVQMTASIILKLGQDNIEDSTCITYTALPCIYIISQFIASPCTLFTLYMTLFSKDIVCVLDIELFLFYFDLLWWLMIMSVWRCVVAGWSESRMSFSPVKSDSSLLTPSSLLLSLMLFNNATTSSSVVVNNTIKQHVNQHNSSTIRYFPI